MKFPLPAKKYQIIYADPPWEYELTGSAINARGMAKQHYETMSTEELCDPAGGENHRGGGRLLPLGNFPTVGKAIKVMEAWGLQYKTAAFVWVRKNRKSGSNFWEMGSYTKANAEVCLLLGPEWGR